MKNNRPSVDVEHDWTLNEHQMLFMRQHNHFIEAALAGDNESDKDLEALRELAASTEFFDLFTTMSFDEAYDRYLTTLEEVS